MMRAKLRVSNVVSNEHEGEKFAETLEFSAVSANSYPPNGSDDNNTYAKFSPSASLKLDCRNPNLWGQFKIGDQFYVDFTRA